jgi:diguanylate cyclase (GGDEF)-like protein
MTIAVTATFGSVPFPPSFWAWGIGTAALSIVIGFVAGVCYARMAVRFAYSRAKTRLSNLLELVHQPIDSAQQACDMLSQFPYAVLTTKQTDRLDNKRSRLMETVASVVDRQQDITSNKKSATPAADLEPFEVTWIRDPEEKVTGLPDRLAFEANLESLIDAGCRSETEGDLLLIRVDKLDHLRSRFKDAGVKTFLQSMSRIIFLSLRDEDLLCQYAEDTFAVLMPAVDETISRKLAETIRDTVRHHHFRLDANGPEVIVTASFGYTPCLPHEHSHLVLNRADDAMQSSSKRGRNQLHIHDGNAPSLVRPLKNFPHSDGNVRNTAGRGIGFRAKDRLFVVVNQT